MKYIRKSTCARTSAVRVRPMLALVLTACSAVTGVCFPGDSNALDSHQAKDRPSRIDRDLSEVTVGRLEGLYRERRYTAVQVTRWYLRRIEELNPRFHALVYVYSTEAIERAAMEDRLRKEGAPMGPLWGVPVVIKDNTSIQGKITGNGWFGYANPVAPLRATKNADVVDRLEAAGAIVVGHGNMPDFATTDSNFSSLGGRTGNAYGVAYSPGGSSGGPAVAVTLNFAVIGQGTDTGNSIRNPASNASLVGLLPTKGLVSMGGIHPYDARRDNTGPLTRTVTDAAIALDVLAAPTLRDGERSAGSPQSFTTFLKVDALKGKRFGVPRFILEGSSRLHPDATFWHHGTSPDTRDLFSKALRSLEAQGATIVTDDSLLPDDFEEMVRRLDTRAYYAEGIDEFLNKYAPPTIGSIARFQDATGLLIPLRRLTDGVPQRQMATDPEAIRLYVEPHQQLLDAYHAALSRYRLDGFVYPALQVPPNDERKILPPHYPSDGPYSATGWVNWLGVPAVVVPAGFYPNGMPFGIELSADLSQDGQLLGYAYAFEQATHARRPPPL